MDYIQCLPDILKDYNLVLFLNYFYEKEKDFVLVIQNRKYYLMVL